MLKKLLSQFFSCRSPLVRKKFKVKNEFSTTNKSFFNINRCIYKGVVGSMCLSVFCFGGYYFFDAESAIHKKIFVPLIFKLTDGEEGHKLVVKLMKYGIFPKIYNKKMDEDSEILNVNVLGKKLKSPIGMSAGFDKDGEVIDQLFNLGFSYVEIGTVTPLPQYGNPKPRVFRNVEEKSIINRYGFNSQGHFHVAENLEKRAFKKKKQDIETNNLSFEPNKALAINLGKNKFGNDVDDYVSGVRKLGPYADFLVINVSSPNTPGLRELQSKNKLDLLLKEIVNERNSLKEKLNGHSPSILLKISPDLNESEIKSIATSALNASIDGIIVSNTTVSRPNVSAANKDFYSQTGGLSGPHLKKISISVLRSLRKYTMNSNIVLISSGGISSANDIIDYANAGASLVQLYSSFVFEGPSWISKLENDLKQILINKNKTWMDLIKSN